MQSIHRYTWAGVLGALAKQGRAKEALEVRRLVFTKIYTPTPNQYGSHTCGFFKSVFLKAHMSPHTNTRHNRNLLVVVVVVEDPRRHEGRGRPAGRVLLQQRHHGLLPPPPGTYLGGLLIIDRCFVFVYRTFII